MGSGMHSTLSRFNSITSFATTVLFAVLALVALVAYPFGYAAPPSSNLSVHTFQLARGSPPPYLYASSPLQELGSVRWDVDADLSQLFNWNTKQVFLSISALYDVPPKVLTGATKRRIAKSAKALPEGETVRTSNEVVLWDGIVDSRDEAHVRWDNLRNKYPLREVSRSFQYVVHFL